jgi:2-polyprenyl-3-methyl-5-hydroxy-6-metoxy-1,4-benzoquinol methylase
MPTSNPENKLWVIRKIKSLEHGKILDVGAGQGDYLELIKAYLPDNVIVDAVEAWEPYIEKFNLRERYNNVFIQDVREFEDFKYDIVIFGDVLEHMPESDAVDLWNKMSKQAKCAIISIPIIHHPQGAYEGNPYEIHHEEDWTTERVLDKFYGIVEHKEFKVTGTFIAKFDN